MEMNWMKVLAFFTAIGMAGLFIYEGYFRKYAKHERISPARVRAIILGPGFVVAAIVGLARECSGDLLSENGPLGEWTLQLSCDDYTICNQCRKVSFTSDGFITTTSEGKTHKIARWAIKNDRLEFTAFDDDSTFETGMYSMRYHKYGETIELELDGWRSSFCYELTRPTSNGL